MKRALFPKHKWNVPFFVAWIDLYWDQIILLKYYNIGFLNIVICADVFNALKHRFRVSSYLIGMLWDHLSERVLLYDTSDGPRVRLANAIAAQGSNLGPELWNLMYNGIFEL